MSSKKVLLLEDSVPDSELILGLFSEAKLMLWEVTTVRRLGEGIESLKAASYDLVLLDLNLPDSQGLDSLKELRKFNSEVAVVVLTSIQDSDLALETLDWQAQDYLIKDELTYSLLKRSLLFALERSRRQKLQLHIEETLRQRVREQTATLEKEILQRAEAENKLQEVNLALEEKIEEVQQVNVALQETLEALQAAQEAIKEQNLELSQVNQSLAGERQRYQDLFEFAPDGYVVTDANGIIQEVNQAFSALLGHEKKRLLKKPLFCYVHRSDQETLFKFCLQLQTSPTPHICELSLSLNPKSEVNIPVLVTAVAIGEEGETFSGIRWIFKDIAHQKATKKALKESERNFRQIADNIQEVFFIRDLHSNRLIYISPAYERIWRRSCESIYQNMDGFIDTIYPEDRQRFLQMIEEQNAGIGQEIEYRIVRPNGELRWIFNRAVIIFDRQDQPERVVAIAEDITQRKQAEFALQQVNQELEERVASRTAHLETSQALLHQREREIRSLVENTPDAIARIDRNLRYVYTNSALTTLTGVPTSEIMGKTKAELGLPPDLVATTEQAMKTVFETGTPQNLELSCHFPAGVRWVQFTFFPERNAEGEINTLLQIARDVTHSKQAQQDLQESQEKFRLLVENIKDVFFIVDWKTQKIIYINPSYEEVWGRSCKSLYENPSIWIDAIHPEDRDHVLAMMASMYETREDFQEVFRLIRPDGTIRWVRDFSSVIYDATGEPRYIGGLAEDITEQKEAQIALQNSQARFQSLVNNLPGVVYQCFIYPEGHCEFTYISPHCLEILGIQGDVLLENSAIFRERILPEDQQKVIDSVAEANRKLQPWSEEFRWESPSGEVKWIRGISRPQAQDDDSILWDGILLDISKRKQTEAELAEKQAFIQRIADATPNILYIYDLEVDDLIYVNQEVTKILGYSLAEVQDFHLESSSALLHPQDAASYKSHLDQLKTDRTGEIFEWEYCIRNAKGEWCWLLNRYTVFTRNPNGVVKQVIGTAQDITERKQMEVTLREQEEHLRLALDAANMGTWDWSPRTGKITWSENLERLFGMQPGEFDGSYDTFLSKVYSEDRDRVIQAIEKAVKENADYNTEFRILLPDGTIRWVASQGQVLFDEMGKPYRMAGVDLDITEQKHYEEQLQAGLAEKEVLLQEVHHRVKNNLNVIYSLLNMQCRNVEDKKVRQALFDSQRRVQTMALIHEQLYESKDFAEIDYQDYIQRLIRNLSASSNLECNRISTVIEVEPISLNLQTAIPCGLIINELVTNAFKHGFQDGRSGTIWIELRQQDDNTLHLCIRNNGIPLPSDWNMPQVSLGMQLVQILTRQLRGKFSVSAEGETRFDLQFPLNWQE